MHSSLMVFFNKNPIRSLKFTLYQLLFSSLSFACHPVVFPAKRFIHVESRGIAGYRSNDPDQAVKLH
jgi:hypothetical protein